MAGIGAVETSVWHFDQDIAKLFSARDALPRAKCLIKFCAIFLSKVKNLFILIREDLNLSGSCSA